MRRLSCEINIKVDLLACCLKFMKNVMSERVIGTNIKVACLARCAWDLGTKHWLWAKHVPEDHNNVTCSHDVIIFSRELDMERTCLKIL